MHEINLTLIINKEGIDKWINGTNSNETKKKRQTEKQTIKNKREDGGEGPKYICREEHWVLYGIVESLYCISETYITMYFNYAGIKI